MLEGASDRDAYIESLELIRGLEFDVLLPWAASGESYSATTNPADTQRRIDAITERLRAARTTDINDVRGTVRRWFRPSGSTQRRPPSLGL